MTNAQVISSLGYTPYNSTNPSSFTSYSSNQATDTTSSVTFAQVSSTGDVIAFSSDDRLKNRGNNIENALEKVESLNGFHFNWNDTASDLGEEFDKNVNHVGVSAQEVEKILPEVVQPAPVNNEYKTVQYEKLVPLLIEAIKELKKETRLYTYLLDIDGNADQQTDQTQQGSTYRIQGSTIYMLEIKALRKLPE